MFQFRKNEKAENTMQFDIKVLNLLSSKLLHDIISPVSAAQNGIELLEEMGSDQHCLELIADSNRAAIAKLKYFRVALGQSYSATQIENCLPILRDITNGYFSNSRMTVTWLDEWELTDDVMAKVKFCLILALVVEKIIPIGGEMVIGKSLITVTAQKVKSDTELWQFLTGVKVTLNVDTVFVEILNQIANQFDFAYQVQEKESGFDIKLI